MKDAAEDLPTAGPRARTEEKEAHRLDTLDITQLAARDAARYFSPGQSRPEAARGWRDGRVEPLAGRHRERGRDRAGRRWRRPV